MMSETISREIRRINLARKLRDASACLSRVSWRDWIIAACGVGVFLTDILAHGGH